MPPILVRPFFLLSQTSNIITLARTFPASGRFSGPQRELYNAVLSAQKDLIALCTTSAGYSLQELHRESCVLLKKALNGIGFNLHREGDLERILYPHYLGHPVGIGALTSSCL